MRLGPQCLARTACLFAAALAGSMWVSPLRAQDAQERVNVGDLTRTYVVHLPKGYDPQQHYPVVILFHSVNQDADTMAHLTRFNDLADQDSIIAVYPNALGGHWRFGVGEPHPYRYGPYRRPWWGPGYPPPPPPQRRREPEGERKAPPNDVEFLNLMLDKLATKFSIDTRRIYAAGLGDGGFMALRAGCSVADRIAAVAAVGAAMPRTMVCVPSRAVPAALISGTDDPIVPYDGGEYKGAPFRVLSAEHSADAWAKLNRCSDKPKESKVPALQKGGKDTRLYTYEGCQNDAQVALYAVKGGGHTWPSGEQYMVEKQVGKTSNSINANETLWSFFVTRKIVGESGIERPSESKQSDETQQPPQ